MKLSAISLLLLLAVGQASFAHGSSDCESYQYMYTLQPPEAFVCNPYLNGILNLTCAVTGELIEGIQWYFQRPDSTENIMLTNESSNVTLIPNSMDNFYSLNLVISDLNSNNEGFYWCRGLVLEGDYILELTSSQEFELLPQSRYINFACLLNKAIKDSNVRCAAIIPLSTDPPIISSSVPYPDQVTSIDILVPLDPTSSVEETHITSTQIITPSLSTPQMATSQPTIATSDEPTPPTSSLQLSDIILYSILALLGFLILLVLSLSIVISVLCCRKRRTGLEGKEAPYDQFSTESEALHGTLTLKSLESFPIAPPPPPPYRLPNVINTSRSDTSSSSGVYDEIHTVVSQYGTQPCMLGMAIHEYQEIPEVEQGQRSEAEPQPSAESHEREPAAPRGEASEHRHSSYENPYDLPDQLQQSSSGQARAHPQQATPPELANAPSQQNRNYHSLETPSLLTEGDTQSSIDGSSDFTNSNLLVTPPPEDNPHTPTAGRIGPDEIVTEAEVESTDQGSAAPLPIIPENPYHTLEESSSSTGNSIESPSTQNKCLNGVDGHISVSSDAEVHQPQAFPPVQRLQDEGYDRLVGPPHIYHILQKSPSLIRPRVRACSPTSGYHHLDNRMDTGAQSPQCMENGPPSFPLTEDPLVLQSEESSTLSSSEIFDDPQYNFSPKRMISAAKSNTDRHRNSHNGQFTTLERAKIEKGIDLSKYRGDYERDPMYMKLIHRLTEAAKQSEPSEDADRLDISPFLKLPRSRSMSLPDLMHTYQPLEPNTRDPLRDYETLQKEETVVVNDTNA